MIAILAVLGVAVVLVLNPAELIRRSRDATRISDLATLNSAMAFYLTEATTPNLGTCAVPRITVSGGLNAPFSSGTPVAITGATANVVDGTGWVSVNFSGLIGGSPLASLPRDPISDTTYYYAYACHQDQLKYEINAKMESQKYTTAPSDVISTDGGNRSDWYEVGNSLTLAPTP